MNQVSVASVPEAGIVGAYVSPVHPLPDGNYAHILVKDDSNAPAIQRGDVLIADLSVNEWKWDGLYVVEVHGQQLIRRVQSMPQGLYVFCGAYRDNGYFISKRELRVLAAVDSGILMRRFA